MTQDAIIEMANEAELCQSIWIDSPDENLASVIRFAKLVAAKVEARYMQLFLDPENQPTQFGTATQEYRELEIKIERELCVKAVADALYGQDGCYKAMRAIRARGEA